MLVAIIGGVIVGLVIAASACAVCHESLTVPPKGLVRRWRAETSAGSRGRYCRRR
jgi:hypothetical protein